MQGEGHVEVAKAIRDGNLEAAPITPAERLLLQFVETITLHAYRVTGEQVQELRDAGWTEPQIAEAAYNAAFFNMAVRLADAWDIHPPPIMDADGVPRVLRRET